MAYTLHICIYENRYQVACLIMQNAAVQDKFCIKLDTIHVTNNR